MATQRPPTITPERAAQALGEGLLAFESAPVPLFVFLPSGVLIKVNQAWRTLLGYEEGAVSGMHFTEIVHPDDSARAVAGHKQAVAAGAYVPADEYRVRAKDGSYVRLRASSLPIRDEDGTIRYFVGSVTSVLGREDGS